MIDQPRMVPVVGFEESYSVTEEGNVWSHLRNKWMSRTVDQYGYEVCTLIKDGVWRTYRIHILVLEAHVGPRPEGLLGLHKDDVKLNNNLGNLYWGTHGQNMADRTANKGDYVLKGEDDPKAKLTNNQVQEMRAAYMQKGESAASLARRFEISEQSVHRALAGQTYTEAAGPLKRKGHSKIDEAAVREIRKLKSQGFAVSDIMLQYGVSGTAVQNIVNRKTWAHVS